MRIAYTLIAALSAIALLSLAPESARGEEGMEMAMAVAVGKKDSRFIAGFSGLMPSYDEAFKEAMFKCMDQGADDCRPKIITEGCIFITTPYKETVRKIWRDGKPYALVTKERGWIIKSSVKDILTICKKKKVACPRRLILGGCIPK